jgi:type IV pilus assembly protein PilY1
MLYRLSTSAFFAFFVGHTATLQATSLNLAEIPMFLGGEVEHNMIVALDDSGSMDSEVLFPSNDGALWWNTGPDTYVGYDKNDNYSQTNVDNGVINFNVGGGANSTWKKFVYLFPNGTGTGDRVYSDSWNDHYAIPPIAEYAYTRSPAYNTAYFDPAVGYTPWPSYGSTTYAQINPTSAPADPVFGTYRFDLTQDIESNSSNYVFRMYPGSTIPAGTRYSINGGSWNTAGSNIPVTGTWNVGIRYFPATFYLPDTDQDGDWLDELPTDFGWSGTPITGYGPDGSPLFGFEIKSGNFSSSSHYDAAIDNFANWFSYYRKRHLATRGGVVSAFQDITGIRVGFFRINNRNTVSMRDFDLATDRNAFYYDVYHARGSGGTPNRESMLHMGNQFKNNTNIIQYACQKNYGVLFTDGYATTWTGAGVGDTDGDDGAPYADAASNTIADISRYFYENNIRQDLNSCLVAVPAGCPEENGLALGAPRTQIEAGALNCNNCPHMVSFGVVLDREGRIFQVDADCTSDPYACNAGAGPTWPSHTEVNATRGAAMIDDLWHAAIDSHGQMLNAKTPQQVAAAFRQVLQIFGQETGAASAVAVNSGSVSSDANDKNYVYQARFNSQFWSGELRSYLINTDGSIGAQQWNAADSLELQHWSNGREIITYNPDSKTGIRFRPYLDSGMYWDQLTTAQQQWLSFDPFTNVTDTTKGKNRMQFIRGRRDETFLHDNGFRNREFALGDLIHSAPAYVGPPNSLFPEVWDDLSVDGDGDGSGVDANPSEAENNSSYSDFRTNYKSRRRIIYAGGNDGMLHGFDAGDGQLDPGNGQEVFGFIPSMVYPRLSSLASPQYGHLMYVDGSVTFMEAYYSGAWHTVLGSGLGAGGQGIYMLDITNPTTLTNAETNASNIVMWEFTDRDQDSTDTIVDGDPDLGYSYFQAINVVRMHDGNWYVVIGNGYDSTEPDDPNLDTDGDGITACGLDLADPSDDDPDEAPCTISQTGNAVLYFIDLATGDLKKKIDTGVGMGGDITKSPNGMSTPAPVDLDGDFIVDVIYAGDLYGNLWRFDVTDSDPTNWHVAFSDAGNPAPLFKSQVTGTTTPQPITVRPQIGYRVPGQDSGVMVYFGTGKYFETGDNVVNTATPAQTFYGIWDRSYYKHMENSWPDSTKAGIDLTVNQHNNVDSGGTKNILRTHLLSQNITNEVGIWRATSNNPISWHTAVGYPSGSTHLGWLLELDPGTGLAPTNDGERAVTDAVLRGDRVIFTTLIPSVDPCLFGGTGWVMELKLSNGGRIDGPIFDTNGDGNYTSDDYIDTGTTDSSGNTVSGTPSGYLVQQGIPSKPVVVDLPEREHEGKYLNTSSGDVEFLLENTGRTIGRQSWRQID